MAGKDKSAGLNQQNDSNKSGAYDKNQSSNSGLYDFTSGHNTGKLDDGKSNPVLESRNIHNISVNDEIILSGHRYTALDIISCNTGEAIIYKISETKGNFFALKLYYPFSKVKEEPNQETLSRISKFDDPDILKLYSFGTNQNKYLGKFCYEISDYAEGGNLLDVSSLKKKYSYSFLKKYVIPQILLGLTKLHKNGIVHGDVKPQNIFFKDKEQTDLLIGDYGSAKSYDLNDPKPIHVTSAYKGTNYYMSSEQSKGIMRIENDYFSFGMVLFHLMYPEHFADNNDFRLVDKEKYERITELISAHLPVIDFDDAYKDINDLVAGLTLGDARNRWGEEKVKSWMKGNREEVVYSNLTQNVQIKISGYKIKNYSDLIKFIETYDNWYEELIEDKESYSLLLSLLMQIDDREKKVRFNELIVEHKQDGADIIKTAILRFVNPDKPLACFGSCFNFKKSKNIRKDIAAFINTVDDNWKKTALSEIKKVFFEFELSLRLILSDLPADKKSSVELILNELCSVLNRDLKIDSSKLKCEMFSKLSDSVLIKLFHFYNKDRGFRDSSGKNFNDLKEVAFYFARNAKLFEDNYCKLEKNSFLEKINQSALLTQNYEEFLFTVFRDKAIGGIEITDVIEDPLNLKKITILYKYNLSLIDFFRENNINLRISKDTAKGKLRYSYERNNFTPLWMITDSFIKKVCEANYLSENIITRRNIREIKDKIKNGIYKKFDLPRFLIVVMFTGLLGWFLGYLLLFSSLAPYPLENLYPDSVLPVFVCIFMVMLTLGINYNKRKIKHIGVLFILFSFIPLVLFASFTRSGYFEHKKIVAYRHNFYVRNFLLDTGDEKLIPVKNLLKEYNDNLRTDYNSLFNAYVNKDIFYITSSCKILEREIIGRGLFSKDDIVFKEINPHEIPVNLYSSKSFIITSLLINTNDLNVGNHLSFRLKYDIKSYKVGRFTSAGVKFNRYLILSDNNSIRLIALEPIPENSDDNKEYNYFVLTEESKKESYLSSYKKGRLKGNIPFGISARVYNSEILSSASIEKTEDGWNTIDIISSKDNILIKVNDDEVINYTGKTEFDNKFFINNVMNCFEPVADYAMANISVFKLDEKTRYNGVEEVDIHNYVSLMAAANDVIPIYPDSTGNSPSVISLPWNSKVEILNETRDFYYIDFKQENVKGYVIKNGLKDFVFENIN